MITKKRLADRRGRRGFTLVEVIVVLVILAILAAIAIPALTGYIDKAEDKKWIAQARNHMVAARSALNDLNSEGKLNPKIPGYLEKGDTSNYTNKNFYSLDQITSPGGILMSEINKLLGEGDYKIAAGSHYYWFDIFGPRDTGTTIWNADGFIYMDFPEGRDTGDPVTVVTYKLHELSGITTKNDFDNNYFWVALKAATYEPNAGFYVYHFIK